MSSQRKRRCFTFLEVLAATAVLAICLIPATQYMAKSMSLRRRLEQDKIMVMLAVQTIEHHMAAINWSFSNTQETGTFASQGQTDLAYEVVSTDSAIEGGIPGHLMAISVSVWFDENSNLVHDANEAIVELNTAMARSIGS